MGRSKEQFPLLNLQPVINKKDKNVKLKWVFKNTDMGGSGIHMYKRRGFSLLIWFLIFLTYPMEME